MIYQRRYDIDDVAEIERNPVSKYKIQPVYGEVLSRLRRYGTAKPVSRDQFSGANGDRELFILPVQLTTSSISNLIRLILLLIYVMTIHTIIHNISPVRSRFGRWSLRRTVGRACESVRRQHVVLLLL